MLAEPDVLQSTTMPGEKTIPVHNAQMYEIPVPLDIEPSIPNLV